MPGKPKRRASTERQRKFMGAELGRKRAGKSTETGMSAAQLAEFARKPVKPAAAKKPARKAPTRSGKRGY